MDEAYKILPKTEHVYWDRFKEVRSEPVTNYVRSILGDKVNQDRFMEVLKRLTTGKRSPSTLRKNYEWLKKFGWIK